MTEQNNTYIRTNSKCLLCYFFFNQIQTVREKQFGISKTLKTAIFQCVQFEGIFCLQLIGTIKYSSQLIERNSFIMY